MSVSAVRDGIKQASRQIRPQLSKSKGRIDSHTVTKWILPRLTGGAPRLRIRLRSKRAEVPEGRLRRRPRKKASFSGRPAWRSWPRSASREVKNIPHRFPFRLHSWRGPGAKSCPSQGGLSLRRQGLLIYWPNIQREEKGHRGLCSSIIKRPIYCQRA